MTNNFLHSFFSQCNITINGVTITQASEHYQYLSYLKIFINCGTDAAARHLSNAYWYLDTGDMQTNKHSAENLTATANRGFLTRWKRFSTSREVQLFGRLHSDICNVPLVLLPVLRLQIILPKARPSFYLMNKSVDSKIFSNIWTPKYWSEASGRTSAYCWLTIRH